MLIFRTPRRELAKQVTPSKAGHLLSKYMHDEDNKYGLRVTNKMGDKWIAYGDGMLLNDESEGNHRIAVAAVQTSVDEVYEAFLYPGKAKCSSRVTDYIPFVDSKEKLPHVSGQRWQISSPSRFGKPQRPHHNK